jgi:phosphoribosylformylglycinamidine synthase PurS subunit
MVKLKVMVKYLSRVEDPESITILNSLKTMGYKEIKSLSISKTYEFTVDGKGKKPRETIEEISKKVLTNPVIQEFSISEE